MIADFSHELDSDQAADLDSSLPDASEISPAFAQHHPLQIAMCLRKLVTGQDFVTVEFNDRQIVTQLLDIDSRNARFIFDAGSVVADNHALTGASRLVFRSLPGGIRTEFVAERAQRIVFEGRLAFEAPFPAVLFCVQRREYFRVQTPALDPYTVSGRYADGDSFMAELQDLSLGGLALRTSHARFGLLEAGCILRGVTVLLGNHGVLKLDLEIVAPRHVLSASGERRFVMGCRFVELPGAAERMLQRVITQLETKRQALLPRD